MTATPTFGPAPAAPPTGLTTQAVVTDLRRVSAAVTAGVVAGFVVAGWGSRLAMMLLARLNPQVTGRISDDGFRIGQFRLADTLGLVILGTIIGAVGGLFFLALRPLRFGPTWFRTTSMVVGPAVVVGAILVNTDGIDFTLLEPSWLPIALFVALPGLYAYAVMRLADRWLEDGSPFMTSRRAWLAGFLPLIPAFPVFGMVATGLAARVAYLGSSGRMHAVLGGRAVAIAARWVVTAIFAVALVKLVRDATVLL